MFEFSLLSSLLENIPWGARHQENEKVVKLRKQNKMNSHEKDFALLSYVSMYIFNR